MPGGPVEPTPTGVRLRLRVQPRASRTELAGLHGTDLRIRLAAPPVDGAANEALVSWLAERLALPRRNVTLVSGAGSRSKIVAVDGIALTAARRALGLESA